MALDPSCPWQSFAPATITFCERQLCAWIQTPANTYSNLVYVAVSYYCCVLAYRQKREPLAMLGVIGIVLGIGSFLFHATGTFWGEVLDVGAMYMLVIYSLAMCLWRVHKPRRSVLLAFYFITLALSLYLLLEIKWIGITLFAALVSVTVLYEVYLAWFSSEKCSRRDLAWVVGLFAVAYTIWWGDITGRWCLPDNHFIQGHAAWHVINAFCIYFLYKFYTQFIPSRSENS